MRKINILAVSVFALLAQAMGLYDKGMYDGARAVFQSVSQQAPSPVSDGYIILCDIKTRNGAYRQAVEAYDAKYGRTVLSDKIHFENASVLFDEGIFDQSASEYEKVNEKSLSRNEFAELYFKRAFSYKEIGEYEKAAVGFKRVEMMYSPEYSPAARYALGYLYYDRQDFSEAFNWFKKASTDDRFAQTANYYMLECRFMDKNYAYVTEHADEVYQSVPAERKQHISRIISEAYLVQGDAVKAKQYFDQDALQSSSMSRADYFYAGSLQYALGEYQNAISNYSMMSVRTDSIGQIANYQLGYSFIKTKNKVSALNAFRDAAALPFDAAIQEDAYFNYAKLAFDLNNDASVFTAYLDKYASSKKGDQIYGYIALTALYNHKYAEAVEAYDNIDELDQSMRANYMKANYLRAKQLVSSGSWKDAVNYLRAASFYTDRQDNFNKLTRYWLAEALFQSGSYSEAHTVFEDLYNLSALDKMTEGKTLPYNIAYCYLQEGDFDTASKWFDIYITSSDKTNRQDALYRRADCDYAKKDYQAAVKTYAKASGEFSQPNDIYPYYQMAICYGLLGKGSEKLNTLLKVKKATSDAPYYDEALYELGRSYVEMKKDSDANTCFHTLKASTRDSSFYARAYIELGMIASNNKKYEEALDYYKVLVDKMPHSGYAEDAMLAIESIYQRMGEPDKYLSYIKSLDNPINKSASETEMLYFNSAEQMFLGGNYQKALAALDRYVSEYPQGKQLPQAFFYIAESYKELGQKEKACDYYAKTADISSEGSFVEIATLNFANLSFALEHYSDAYSAYDSLREKANIENNKFTAAVGMMRSAYKSRSYSSAIRCAEALKADNRCGADLLREADYVLAHSYLATSQREQAFAFFRNLALQPSTDEGAEATYMLIQDAYDQGNFVNVENLVYKFSDASGDQSYWLAKAFIVLGDSFMEQDKVSQARATFESVRDGYSPVMGASDDVLENVRMRLEKMKEYEN